jgi:uncharacterized protein (TIGR02996 family)
MDERAAFESKIDENPLEASTHLVYADWLDENGEPDEAAFRRSMGEWIGSRSRIKSSGKSGFFLGRTHPWYAWSESLPKGVLNEHITRDGRELFDPVGPDYSDAREYGRALHWPTYRGMEEGLRRAFMTNLQRQRPERLSRATIAIRRLRRRS